MGGVEHVNPPTLREERIVITTHLTVTGKPRLIVEFYNNQNHIKILCLHRKYRVYI